MKGIEKILEEVNRLIEKHKNNAYELIAKEPLTQCYTETDIEQTKVHELAVVRNIIRKHMNDVWISVEERLPEGRTRVICQFDNGDIELLWQDWESDPESLTYWTDFDFMAEKKVIAWRELPEPYRPERSEHDGE